MHLFISRYSIFLSILFFGCNWSSHAKSWLIGKDLDVGRDRGQEEKGTTEDEMAGWHHWLDGCESEWTPGVGDGQGGLACCDSWGRRVRHDWATELNWTDHCRLLIPESTNRQIQWTFTCLGFPCGSADDRIHLQCRRPWFDPWVGKIPWRRERLPTPVF